MAKNKKRITQRQKKAKSKALLLEIVAIGLLALASLLAVSLWRGAQSMGLFGLALRRVFLALLGTQGSSLFVILLFIISLRFFFVDSKPTFNKWELPCALLLFCIILAALQLHAGLLHLSVWMNGTAGGFIGNALVWSLVSIFGSVGAWVVLAGLAIGSLIGLTRTSLASLLQEMGGKVAKLGSARSSAQEQAETSQKRGSRDHINEPATTSELTIRDYSEQAQMPVPPSKNELDTQTPSVWASQAGDEGATDWQVEQLIIPNSDSVSENLVIDKAAEIIDYKLPTLKLLRRPVRQRNLKQNRDIYENSRILETTLEDFGIKAKVVHATKGPAVTRYEIQPAPGTKVSRVTSLADDLALSLACSEVRIEAPIPGKAAIGIEIPNETIAIVGLREVLDSAAFRDSASVLTVALGKDITGEVIIADLADMPHLLIAGATGSGKSVCINSIITSVLYKAHPDQVKFLMIDPKVVELAAYNGIPHLLAPVVNHPKKAAAALKWATAEMEKRYTIFAQAGVRDITRYNEWATNADKERLPSIVIIIDELADLMMVARADVEDAICRLAQMARAAGMHLVIGTQRPSTDVITGLIKANIPSRISFAVSSAVDSRVILDTGGAEKLLGKGDMLFAPVGLAKPVRVQGAYITNSETEGVIEFVGSQMESQYVDALCRLDEAAPVTPSQERDELFPEAKRLVTEAGQASVSLLQRRLRVGYTRAARMIDQLEEAGIVGPYEGSKPRLVFSDRDASKNLSESQNKQQSM